ncbi:MAG: hypothetical protein RR954_07295 [Christensenellaceae bacterium]
MGKHQAKRKKVPIVAVVVVVIAAVVVMIGAISGWFTKMPEFIVDSAVQTGELTANMSKQEIEEYLQETVDKSKFLFNINARPTFENGTAEGDLLIQNPIENAYGMKVTITLDDTGETVYQTDGILPGQYILMDKLDKPLLKGEYAATAVLTAYDGDKEIGQSAAGLVISVKA